MLLLLLLLLHLLLEKGISSLSIASTCTNASTYAKFKLVLTLLKLIDWYPHSLRLLLLLLLKMGIRCQHLSQTFNLRQVQIGVNVIKIN